MLTLKVQQYIKEFGLEKLTEAYAIKAKRHQQYNNLVLLKYSQYDSPMDSLIVQQCRGLILDELNDWAVVSYPYNKFFNYGEVHAAAIDWESATLEKKLDGSLMTLYSYNNQWLVASSGTPDGSGDLMGMGFTFADLFWAVWDEMAYDLPSYEQYKNFCFMFELETPLNRIVVKQDVRKLTLHGVRNVVDFKEHSAEQWAATLGWKPTPPLPFLSIEQTEITCAQLNPLESEGFIVRDANFNRIKLKNEQYVRLSHMRDGTSRRSLIEVALKNEGAELLAYFPEFKDIYEEICLLLSELCSAIEADYQLYAHLESQKEFALAVLAEKNKRPWSGALFQLRAGKAKSAMDFLRGIAVQKVETHMDYYAAYRDAIN